MFKRPGGVIFAPTLDGGIDEITSFFLGARHPFCPGLGGAYCNQKELN